VVILAEGVGQIRSYPLKKVRKLLGAKIGENGRKCWNWGVGLSLNSNGDILGGEFQISDFKFQKGKQFYYAVLPEFLRTYAFCVGCARRAAVTLNQEY